MRSHRPSAASNLAAWCRRQGVTVVKGSSAFLQVLSFYSPDGRYDDLAISNYVTLNVLDALKRVPGTTSVQMTLPNGCIARSVRLESGPAG